MTIAAAARSSQARQEPIGLESLRQAAHALVELRSTETASRLFANCFNALLVVATDAAAQGASHEELAAALDPVRSAVAESTLVRRLQSWPRGYQGDFETIEQIVSKRNLQMPVRLLR